MQETPSTLVIGQVVLGILTIISTLLLIYRENRNRRWQEEDRKRLAEELALKTEETKQELIGHITENTDISREAFREANEINKKILAIGEVRTKGSIINRRPLNE